MLTITEGVPPEAFRAALDFASRVLSSEAVDDSFELSNLPILSFAPRGYEMADMRISDFECRKVIFPILAKEGVDAFVSVSLSPSGVRASSMSYVSGQEGFQRAFRTSDMLVSREGEYQIRMVEIPAISEYFFWVSGEHEWFVDRINDRVLNRDELEGELALRLEAAIRFTPGRSGSPGGTGLDG